MQQKFKEASVSRGKSDIYIVSSKGDFFNFTKVSNKQPLRRLNSLLHTKHEHFLVFSQEREAFVVNFPVHLVQSQYPKIVEALRRIDRISTVKDLSNYIEAEKVATKKPPPARKGSIQVMPMTGSTDAPVKMMNSLQAMLSIK